MRNTTSAVLYFTVVNDEEYMTMRATTGRARRHYADVDLAAAKSSASEIHRYEHLSMTLFRAS